MKITIKDENVYNTYDFNYVQNNDGVYKSTNSDNLGYIISSRGYLIFIDDVIEECEEEYWKGDRFIKTKITLELG